MRGIEFYYLLATDYPYNNVVLTIFLPFKGRPLSKGVKYILRTDLMFVRIATVPMSPALRYLDEAKYIEAEKLFQESIRRASISRLFDQIDN